MRPIYLIDFDGTKIAEIDWADIQSPSNKEALMEAGILVFEGNSYSYQSRSIFTSEVIFQRVKVFDLSAIFVRKL